MKALRTQVPDATVLLVLEAVEQSKHFKARDVRKRFELLGFPSPFSRAAADNLLRRLKRADLITYGRHGWQPL